MNMRATLEKSHCWNAQNNSKIIFCFKCTMTPMITYLLIVWAFCRKWCSCFDLHVFSESQAFRDVLVIFCTDDFLLNWRVVQSGQEAIKSRAGSIKICLIVIYTEESCLLKRKVVRTGSTCISERRVQRADSYHNLNIFNEVYSHTKVVCWNVWVPKLSPLSLMHWNSLSDRQ